MLIRGVHGMMRGRQLVMIQLLLLLLVQLVSVAVSETPKLLTIEYQELKQAPADSYKLEDITLTDPSPNRCLLKCSKNDLCRAVILQDTTCSLYSTSSTAGSLQPGEIAIAEMHRTVNYD